MGLKMVLGAALAAACGLAAARTIPEQALVDAAFEALGLPEADGAATALESPFEDKTVVRRTDRHTEVTDLDDVPPLSLTGLARRLEAHMPALRTELAAAAGAGTADPQHEDDGGGSSPFPDNLYAFVPTHVADILPGAAATSWSAPCFKETSMSLSGPAREGQPLELTLHMGKKSSVVCEDHYLFTTVSSWHTDSYLLDGKHTLHWHNLDELEVQDVNMAGVRVFRFYSGMPTVVADIYATAKLFTGALSGTKPGVPDSTAEDNIKFLKDYAHFHYSKRSDAAAATVLGRPGDGVQIRSGDLLGIIRLDGLDPLIAWGTASRLGHTTMALEINGEMYVVESQDKTNYWPKNFIQRTPLQQWLDYAHAADYNVVHLPLSDERRAMFNTTACLEWFESEAEGLLYGFPTLLSGWIDTADNNIPSQLGPGSHNLLGTVFALIDPLLTKYVYKPTAKANPEAPSIPNIWSLTMAKRAGMPNITAATSVAEAYAYAFAKNMSIQDLLEAPEQDDWIYPAGPGYREGKAMVCNVFVCNAWRAGGALTNELNCGETTPFDLYEMRIFADVNRTALPKACLDADPDSTEPYCQLMGKYRIQLTEHYNSVVPFDHMRERCPSQAPTYAERFSPHVKATC